MRTTGSLVATLQTCGDCAVWPGELHINGCDIARCTACGYQRISCDHYDSDTGWNSLWTGIWPGEIEVAMYGLKSLNDVMIGAKWSRRWQLWLRTPRPMSTTPSFEDVETA